MLVNTGKNFLADRIAAAAQSALSHMAIGVGATAETINDTTLQMEAARVALTSKTSSGNVASFTATFPSGTGTGSITEVGLFNAGANGTMLMRKTFGVITKTAGASLTLTIDITLN